MDEPVAGAADWNADPVAIALLTSAGWRARLEKGEIPGDFCVEVGRRVLLAELQFSAWTLRRVEKVVLDRERSLSRNITVEFGIPPDAPTFVGADGRRLRLVPVSLMRRRTLVNLDIRDESGAAIPMPGIRLTQQLDESVLLASIVAGHPELAADSACREWVHRAIAGELHEVLGAYGSLDQVPGSASAPFLDKLRSDDLFVATVNRLRTSFTLYIFVTDHDVATGPSHGSHLIQIGFEEPINWRYQIPSLKEEPPGSDVWRYVPGRPRRFGVRRGLAALGIEPIRMRLQVPGAENAASYHFEMTAPPGVQIVAATLLAARPNGPARAETIDTVTGHVATVGLHGLEIPNGSLCRVQVDLRPSAQGWLATMFVACLAICAVLASVAAQWWHHDPGWDKDQVTNIIVLLVATSAGVTTLVSQRNGGDFAARFVTGARALGTLAMSLPIAISGILVYTGLAPDRIRDAASRWAILALCAASVVPLVAILIAWLRSVRADRRNAQTESPWDMTDLKRARTRGLAETPPPPTSFSTRIKTHKFDTPAVGVSSAEGWYEFYAWDDDKQDKAVRSLEPQAWPLAPGACQRLDGECQRLGACPRRRGG